MKFQLTAGVADGKTIWDSKPMFVNAFRAFEGKRVIVTVEQFKKKRSYLQNSYWWGVVIEICYAVFRGYGWDIAREGTHEMIKKEHLLTPVVDKNGEIVGHYVRSTTDLTTTEMCELIAKVQKQMAEEHGTYIPDPNEELIDK